MDMTFPVIAELEEEETEIVTGDIMKVVDGEEVVTATTEVTITPDEAMKMEEAMREITTTPETIPEIEENTPETEVDIADMIKKLTALK